MFKFVIWWFETDPDIFEDAGKAMAKNISWLVALVLFGCSGEPESSTANALDAGVDSIADSLGADQSAPSCEATSLEQCESAGCLVYVGYVWDDKRGCHTREEVAFCIPSDNCNNGHVLATSVSGQQVFFTGQCSLPPAWQFTDDVTGGVCE